MTIQRNYWSSRSSRTQRVCDEWASSVQRGIYNVNAYNLSPKDILACFQALIDDHPELFWIAPTFGYSSRGRFGAQQMLVNFQPLYSAQDVSRMQQEFERIVQTLRKPTAIDTERAIIDWVLTNVTYEIDNMHNQNAAAALCFKKAQCSGISRAVKYICDACDIPCLVISGEAKGQAISAHAWNLIEIDGNCYHLDVTSILASNPQRQFTNIVFFNESDEVMENTHAWDKSIVPSCPNRYDGKTTGIPRPQPQPQPTPQPQPAPQAQEEENAQPRRGNFGKVGEIFEGLFNRKKTVSQDENEPKPSYRRELGVEKSTSSFRPQQPARTTTRPVAPTKPTKPTAPTPKPVPKPTPKPAPTRPMPTKEQPVIACKTLSEVRQAVERAYRDRRRQTKFMVEMGMSPADLQKAVANSIKMVLTKLCVKQEVNLEISGNVCTVTF